MTTDVPLEGRVLVRNEAAKPCRACGEVHEFLTAFGLDRCDVPIAIDPSERGGRLLDSLRSFGATEPVGDRMAVPWP